MGHLFYTIICDTNRKSYNFYHANDVITEIKKGKSIIRFGDGETALILGQSIHFQKYNKYLAKNLEDIVTNYNNNSSYILCVAERYIQASNKELLQKNLFKCWVTSKAYFNHYFNKNAKYGDAHMFYINGFFENCIAPIIKNKKIIFITKESDILAKQPIIDKVFLNTVWITTPEKDSYDEFDSILESVMSKVEKKEDTVVVISTGPMGKVLAYMLSNMGIQSIDIGHGVATLFKKDNSLEKVLI